MTANDYKALILSNYGNADDVVVFGGEDFDPPKYGRVYVSVKPSSGGVLTEIEKKNIINDILKPKSVVGVIPDIIDPEYTYLSFTAKFSFDETLNNKTKEALRAAITVFLDLYGTATLSKFAVSYTHLTLPTKRIV